MSAQEFFRRGAALAIQSFTKDGKYKSNADVLFYGVHKVPGFSRAQLDMPRSKFDVGHPVEIEFSSHTHNRFRLVCDPLYMRNRHRYPPGCISILSDDAIEHNNCYDVWDVARHAEGVQGNGKTFSLRLPPGKYTVEVEEMVYHPNSVDATLRLRMTRLAAATPRTFAAKSSRHLRDRSVPAASSHGEVYTYDVPLTSCGPSNLVLLDLDLVKKRLWQPVHSGSGVQVPQSALDPEQSFVPQHSVDQQLADVQHEQDTRPTKRQRLGESSPHDDELSVEASPDLSWEEMARQARAYHFREVHGESVAIETPFCPKEEPDAELPTLNKMVGPNPDAEQGFTFELLEDSSDSDSDRRSVFSVDTVVPGEHMTFASSASLPASTETSAAQVKRL